MDRNRVADMKVLIADDHALLAQAVALALREEAGFDVAVTTSRQGAVDELEKSPYDVVLLDLRMPGMHGLSSVAEVVKRAGDGQVVLFTGQLDRQFLDDSIKLGLSGYIPKTMPLKSLQSALQLIRSGQTFIPHIDGPAETDQPTTPVKREPVSDREVHVLRLAADGDTNKEIARALAVTETQVKMIMRNICTKLGARNRAHACIIARERMLI
ncbi:MAG: response regulator transcription factor [Proteobacteria bacterium]|nr:response regulator transcription factor [Pseudomonadota bacterium]